MEYMNEINTGERASDMIIRSDGTIYTFDHTTTEDENGATLYKCKGYLISPDEMEGICNGKLPNDITWDDFLHKIFRTHQHRKADDEYVYAERMLRTTQDSKWEGYISALDAWNATISMLSTNHSTNVPNMPDRPI